MRRILSVLLENESGALSRVIGLFSQRGYNIESLTVAPTDDPTLSRMTIQTVGDEKAVAAVNFLRLDVNEFNPYQYNGYGFYILRKGQL
ncbi:TPA: acetolactate synthase small subunit [Shigella flexneri]